MSAKHDLGFVGKKMRDSDHPYAVFKGTMFGGEAIYKVLKKYSVNLADNYARVMVSASTPATYGIDDMGDMYVDELLAGLSLAEVDGRKPTKEEYEQVAELRSHHGFRGEDTHGLLYTFTEEIERPKS